MTELKCPVCGERLVYWGATGALLKCPKCLFGWGTEELWQALIDSMKEHDLCHDALVERTKEQDETKKKLDIAVDALERIDDIYKVNGIGIQEGIFMGEYAHKALLAILSPEEVQMRTLEQINQKEEK